jgi:HPt (histidine-containing phosphotransfer) domain-containing protein
MASEPMDIDVDPVDGGPKPTATGTGMNDPMAQEQPPPPQLTLVSAAAAASSGSSAEEEARQAIEMLHGDDVGNRVAAAHRLESVAAALGPERTREVCIKMC